MATNWPLHQTRYNDEESSLTPIVHNKKDKAKEIVSYLLNLKSKESGEPAYEDNFGQQNSLVDIEEQESRDDSSVGVECVLDKDELSQQLPRSVGIRGIFPSTTIDSSRGIFPASTSDSQRAKDCILPSARQYKGRVRQNSSSYLGPLPVDEASITSRWSHSSKVKPLFDSDMLSIVSKWSEAGTVDALFNVVENGANKDDPWKAAKRGDLKALKKFHKKKRFDWSLEDQFYHTPLYYACHSGAIVNIDVVPFLLDVTPDNGGVLIEKCRESAINKHVIEILDRTKLERTSARRRAHANTTSPKKSRKQLNNSKNEKSGESIQAEGGSTTAVLHGYQNNLFTSPKSGIPSFSDQSTSTSSLSRRMSFDSMLHRLRGSSKSGKVKKERVPDEILKIESVGRPNEKKKKKKNRPSDALPPRPKATQHGVPNEDDVDIRKEDLHERPQQHTKDNRQDEETQRNDEPKSNSLRQERARSGWPNGKSVSRLRNNDHHRSRRSRSPSLRSRKRREERKKPIIDYVKDRNTWLIENQNKSVYDGDSVNDHRMVLTIHVFEPGQLVYINNCYDVTIHIHGKEMAGMLVENCGRINVKFGTVVSKCEIFYCKKVSIETEGVCPTFDIDRTDGCVVSLSKETLHVTNFVTNKSTDVHVSIPAGDDDDDKDRGGSSSMSRSRSRGRKGRRKDVPIPEQFIHRIYGTGIVQSSASHRGYDHDV